MLEWQHQHRDRLAGYQQYRQRTGHDPDELATAPAVSPWSADLWEAWQHLSGSRQYTMGGAAAIQISEITAWCELMAISDADERYRLLTAISTLDSTYLTQQQSDRDKSAR